MCIRDSNQVGQPDVGPDLAVDVLQFVQAVDRPRVVAHGDATRLLERSRVPEADLGRAVADDEARPVVGDAPALMRVGERLQRRERCRVINEAGLLLPRQLIESIVEDGDALTEVLGIERLRAQHRACLQHDLTDGRLAPASRPFV